MSLKRSHSTEQDSISQNKRMKLDFDDDDDVDNPVWSSIYESSWTNNIIYSAHEKYMINCWFENSVIKLMPWAYPFCIELQQFAEQCFHIKSANHIVKSWVSRYETHGQECDSKILAMMKGHLSWENLLHELEFDDTSSVMHFLTRALFVLTRGAYRRIYSNPKRAHQRQSIVETLLDLHYRSHTSCPDAIRIDLESDSSIRVILESMLRDLFDDWMAYFFQPVWMKVMLQSVYDMKIQPGTLLFQMHINLIPENKSTSMNEIYMQEVFAFLWMHQCNQILYTVSVTPPSTQQSIPHAHKIIPKPVVEMILTLLAPSKCDKARIYQKTMTQFPLLRVYLK